MAIFNSYVKLPEGTNKPDFYGIQYGFVQNKIEDFTKSKEMRVPELTHLA